MRNPRNLPLIALVGFIGVKAVQAEDLSTLQEIVVVAKEAKKTTGEIHQSRQVIQDELIANTQDLVRYLPDVGVSNGGRYSKGVAMRGVEGNRVGILVDGVSLPNAEENSLYARYGNFNSSRVLIDPELVKSIDLMRGSDSFNSGSGALGGSISYRTLDAEDILLPNQPLGALLKSGYASKNREWVNTAGVAYKDNGLEAVGLYSYRNGHEMKSRGNGEDIDGAARGIPDPSKHRNRNYLAKIAYLWNDAHRLSATFSGHRHKNDVDERSYSFIGWREIQDVSERDNLNLAYTFFPQNNRVLTYSKLEYDYQKALIGTYNYKGGRNFITQARELDEILDRKMHTKFHRISGHIDFTPVEFAQTLHQISFRTGISRYDIENRNIDTYPHGKVYNAIQHPVRTTQIYASLQDKIQWNQKWQSELGIRYDYAKLAPQDLRFPCYACAKQTPESATFKNVSGNLGLNYQLDEIWKVAYNLSSGYRIPSASEMFFTYEHPAGSWLANPDLTAERSLHQSLSLQGESDHGSLFVHLYHTRYKDFLYEQETRAVRANPDCDEYCLSYGGKAEYETLYQQAVNFDRAKIYGIEISGKVNLNSLAEAIPQGWNAMASLGYSKGKLSDGRVSLLSIQPLKAIVGFGYDDPQDRWGIQSRLTYLGEKKAKEAQILTYYNDPRGKTQDFPYLNDSAFLFDLFGFIKPRKNITLRAGVYNIFNRKYHTWDTLRGINLLGTTNTVDRDRKGLERYYAPGRNFAASVEVKF